MIRWLKKFWLKWSGACPFCESRAYTVGFYPSGNLWCYNPDCEHCHECVAGPYRGHDMFNREVAPRDASAEGGP